MKRTQMYCQLDEKLRLKESYEVYEKLRLKRKNIEFRQSIN